MDATFEIDALALSFPKGHLRNPLFQKSKMVLGAPRAYLANLPKSQQPLGVRLRELFEINLELVVSRLRGRSGREFGGEDGADSFPFAIRYLARDQQHVVSGTFHERLDDFQRC